MKRVVLIYLYVTLSFNVTYSQNKDIETIFDDAEFFFATEEYEEALYLFQQLVRENPENANFRFRLGMTYLNIPGKETKSIPHLQKATENITLKYKQRSLSEKQAPHHTWFYLGNAYRIDNQLDKALECYRIFQDIRNFEKHYNIRIVEEEIKACERAKIIKDSPLNILKDNLGDIINDGSKNYRPVVNYDETAMVFMRTQKFYEAIMYSYKKDGQWTKPENITPQVGSDGDMTPSGISADGKKLLLIKRLKRTDNGDIYYSELQGNIWTKATPLGKNINSSRNEDHASFSPDGNTIYFSSDRRGGEGELDIYLSKKQHDGTWGPAINLGPKINTPMNETSVFISPGNFNMGGYDIFYSEMNKQYKWTDAVNLGYPVNTTNDNRFYQPVSKTEGYTALFNEKENYGEEDIYRIKILPFTEPVTIQRSLFNNNFTIELEEKKPGNEIIIITYDLENDSLKVKSSEGIVYKTTIKKDDNK